MVVACVWHYYTRRTSTKLDLPTTSVSYMLSTRSRASSMARSAFSGSTPGSAAEDEDDEGTMADEGAAADEGTMAYEGAAADEEEEEDDSMRLEDEDEDDAAGPKLYMLSSGRRDLEKIGREDKGKESNTCLVLGSQLLIFHARGLSIMETSPSSAAAAAGGARAGRCAVGMSQSSGMSDCWKRTRDRFSAFI